MDWIAATMTVKKGPERNEEVGTTLRRALTSSMALWAGRIVLSAHRFSHHFADHDGRAGVTPVDYQSVG
jgi:hypothetical protein